MGVYEEYFRECLPGLSHLLPPRSSSSSSRARSSHSIPSSCPPVEPINPYPPETVGVLHSAQPERQDYSDLSKKPKAKAERHKIDFSMNNGWIAVPVGLLLIVGLFSPIILVSVHQSMQPIPPDPQIGQYSTLITPGETYESCNTIYHSPRNGYNKYCDQLFTYLGVENGELIFRGHDIYSISYTEGMTLKIAGVELGEVVAYEDETIRFSYVSNTQFKEGDYWLGSV